jgi:signal-transduction protein with cAMP-binding, CBS, and nucleotidyltransferase domain
MTIDVGDTLAHAAQRMDEAAVGALVVLDQDRPVGIVTDRDLVVRAMARGYALDSRVDSVMSMGLVAIDATADIRDAIDLFSHYAIRRLPVVDGARMCGMVTLDDIVMDLTQDLEMATKPMAAQVLFGHPEPKSPAKV